MGMMFGEGRQLLLERLRTANALQKEELRKKQIENDRASAKAAIDLIVKLEKIRDPNRREAVRTLLLSKTADLNPNIAGLLPPPKNGKD